MMSRTGHEARSGRPDRGPFFPLPYGVAVFWALGIGLDLIYFVVRYWNKYRLHLTYPYTYPVLPFKHWADFVCFHARFQYLHQMMFFSNEQKLHPRFMYPAPVLFLYKGFYLAGAASLPLFLTVTSVLVMVLAVVLERAMIHRGIEPRICVLFLASVIAGSYPLWFEYALGNMEICIFLLVTFGMIAFLRERFYLCAFLIGLAASMKLFPFIYLALFLARKKYRELACGILTIIIMNILGLWYLGPSISAAYRGTKDSLNIFQALYMRPYRMLESGFDHSLLDLIKSLFHKSYGGLLSSRAVTLYFLCASIGGLALYIFRIRHLPILNQILCLCIAFVLLPPTSHDYTLLHLYFPWALLVLFAIDTMKDGRHVPGLTAAFACFAILLSCESELIWHRMVRAAEVKSVVLIVLFGIAMRYRWELPEGSKILKKSAATQLLPAFPKGGSGAQSFSLSSPQL